MQMKPQAKQIFWNALLLSAATLLMRSIGVSFGVYLTNRAGAETMGLFSLMGGVYGFALTLATSGIQFGVTKLIVEAIGKGEDERVRTIIRRAVLYALLFGCGAMLLMMSSASLIGIRWLKDMRTVRPLRLFAITLPLIALSSVWNGYFTAVRRVYKNAAVQVFEQALKIVFTVYLLTLFLPSGVEGTCCALILGGASAELGSFLLNLFLYLLDRSKNFPKSQSKATHEGRKLMGITLPIALTTYLRSGLITLQHILIPEGLRNSGTSHAAALVAYGSIHNMALPVILYPAALISSFSGLLIPALAESDVKHENIRICYMIRRVWWLALLFSIGVAGILICFSSELGQLLYPNSEASYYIRLLAPLVPIMYIDTATDAMLKGLGEQIYTMKVNIADAALSVALVLLLIPRMGIAGYVVTIYVSEFFNTVFSITRLLCIKKIRLSLFKWIYKPLLCIVLATVSVRAILIRFPSDRIWAGGAIMHCLAVLALYFLLLLITKSIEKEDIEWFKTLFHRNETIPIQHPHIKKLTRSSNSKKKL